MVIVEFEGDIVRRSPGRIVRFIAFAVFLGSLCTRCDGLANGDELTIRAVEIGRGITLHYVDEGKGTAVILVHGSQSDGRYWSDQVGAFAKRYRAVAYSRRYNYPNTNPERSGYSAVVDAEDLAAFIRALHLGGVG